MSELPKGLIDNAYNRELYARIESMIDGDFARRHYDTQHFSIHIFVSGDFERESGNSGWNDSGFSTLLVNLIDKKTGAIATSIHDEWLQSRDQVENPLITLIENGDEIGMIRHYPSVVGAMMHFETTARKPPGGNRPTLANLLMKLGDEMPSDDELRSVAPLLGTPVEDLGPLPESLEGIRHKISLTHLAARANFPWGTDLTGDKRREKLNKIPRVDCERVSDDAPPPSTIGIGPKLQLPEDRREVFSMFRFEDALQQRRFQALDDFMREATRESLTRGLIARSGDPECMSRPEIAPHLDKAVVMGAENPRFTNFLRHQTPEAFRNKMQVMDLTQDCLAAWDEIMKDKQINAALEAGRSLKQTLLENHPMANVSKASMERFFHNLTALSSQRMEYHAKREHEVKGGTHAGAFYPQKTPAMLEKGQEFKATHGELDHFDNLMPLAAVLATFPASHIAPQTMDAGDESTPVTTRNFRDMRVLMNLAAQGGITESFERAARLHRNGEAGFDTTLGWLSRESVRENSEELTQWRDGIKIMAISMQESLENHVLVSMGKDDVSKPRFATLKDSRGMEKRIAQSMHMSQALDLCTQAHQSLQRVMRAGTPSVDLRWNPAITAPFEGHGLRIEPIHSVVDLNREGKILDHCVGTYSGPAMRGDTFLFGVRDGDQRVSTIEIRGGSWEDFRVVQHFGRHNTQPPESAKALEKDFIHKIEIAEILIETDTGVQNNDDWNRMTAVQRQEIESGIAFTQHEAAVTILEEMDRLDPKGEIFSMQDAIDRNGQDFEAALNALQDRVRRDREPPVPGNA